MKSWTWPIELLAYFAAWAILITVSLVSVFVAGMCTVQARWANEAALEAAESAQQARKSLDELKEALR